MTFRWVAAILLCAVSASAQSRPATYAEFNTSITPGDGATLKAMIDAEVVNNIYLRPGNYILNNPVTINRTTSLFIHGAEGGTTRLVAQNPTQDLFVVAGAPLVNFASVLFYPIWPSATTPPNAVALRTIGISPTVIETQDCGLAFARFEFQSPVYALLQHGNYNPGGLTQGSVLVDDPGADVVVLLGNATSNGPLNAAVPDYAHFWKKQGRLKVYSVAFQNTLGPSDIRIETASPLGPLAPDVISNSRSEGIDPVNHPDGINAISRLVQVPATAERVDVVVKNNGGAWGVVNPADPISSVMVDYHAQGTLSLLGNTVSNFSGRRLVEGGPADSRIVSVGNLNNAPDAFNGSSQVFSAADLFRNNVWTGSPTNPVIRWLTYAAHTARLIDMKGVPKIPIDYVPDAIPRPRVTGLLPGMVSVKSAPYNAVGDGFADDTTKIQAALDDNCVGPLGAAKLVYFPAGTYKITDSLKYNYKGGPCNRATGGWFAGAGSDVTTIQMAPGVKKSVFYSDGLHSATIQGLTMRSFTWTSGDPEAATFEANSNVSQTFNTQRVALYDVVLDGGYSAAGFCVAGITAEDSGNCDTDAFFYSILKNAQIGLNSGHQNALMNVVMNSQTLSNVHAFGSDTRGPQPAGGNWYGYHIVDTSTGRAFDTSGAPGGSTFGMYDVVSTAPSYFFEAVSSTPFPFLVENSVLSPVAGVTNPFETGAAQGFIFLYTHVTRAGLKIGQGGLGQSYAAKIQSTIDDWGSAIATDANSQLEEIDWAEPRPMGRVFIPSAVSQSNCVLGALTGCVL